MIQTLFQLDLTTEYIQPMLIHFAMVDYLPFANYQIRNGGVFKHKSENSESTSKDELDILVQKHRTFSDFYAKRLLARLGNYHELIPARTSFSRILFMFWLV